MANKITRTLTGTNATILMYDLREDVLKTHVFPVEETDEQKVIKTVKKYCESADCVFIKLTDTKYFELKTEMPSEKFFQLAEIVDKRTAGIMSRTANNVELVAKVFDKLTGDVTEVTKTFLNCDNEETAVKKFKKLYEDDYIYLMTLEATTTETIYQMDTPTWLHYSKLSGE